MEFKFKFTEKANQDLDEILGYISVELSNPKAASDFLENLLDIIENTCLFPESGSVLKNEFLPVKDIRKKPVNNYIMYYVPDYKNQSITVIRILYGRRNIEEIISEMKKL